MTPPSQSGTERCYGAGGEEMAPSSLREPMECPLFPWAPAMRVRAVIVIVAAPQIPNPQVTPQGAVIPGNNPTLALICETSLTRALMSTPFGFDRVRC